MLSLSHRALELDFCPRALLGRGEMPSCPTSSLHATAREGVVGVQEAVTPGPSPLGPHSQALVRQGPGGAGCEWLNGYRPRPLSGHCFLLPGLIVSTKVSKKVKESL